MSLNDLSNIKIAAIARLILNSDKFPLGNVYS